MFQSIIAPMLLGFSVFMCGMKLMELALHQLAGPLLSTILKKSTATPLHGLAIGTVSSAVLQSSTAVTVLSIGMVNSGLLTFSRTLGIILGTNIGTCLTTELIGLNLNRLSLPLMIVSVAVWLLTAILIEMRALPRIRQTAKLMNRLNTARSASVALFGFGLLLTGITMMQSVGPAIQQTGLFTLFLSKADDSLWWAIAAGTLLTAAVHSSAAVIGLIMGFTAIGAMPAEIGIAVVLGANIGTCFTALLASIGGSRAGQYVALSHVILNAGGALLFVPLLPELSHLSDMLSATQSSQIARAQTLFNVISSLLALPLCYFPAMKRLDRTFD